MDPFTFTASIFGLIGLIDITKISGPSNLSSIDKAQKVNAVVKEDLPILSALLQETNSIFLNTEHPIPESAVTALSSCTNRMSKLQYLLQKNYVLDSSKKTSFQSREISLSRRTNVQCLSCFQGSYFDYKRDCNYVCFWEYNSLTLAQH